MSEEHSIDKSTWPDGPWMTEPDKVNWIDEATDLDCMIVRAETHGALCGYVGVGPDHPYFDRANPYDIPVDVHGGVSYGARCQEGGHVCHIPGPGREHDVYWIGFDCSHFMDVCPAMVNSPFGGADTFGAKDGWRSYRDIAYVTAEVTQLALQLAEMGGDE